MFILLETGMPLQSNDEVFICDEDLVVWDDAIEHYGSVVYNEEGMMPVRRKISGSFEPAQQTTNSDYTAALVAEINRCRADILPKFGDGEVFLLATRLNSVVKAQQNCA